MNDELLTIQDIADLFRCNYRTARDVKVKLIGFPKPAPGSSLRIPLWLRSEVAKFLNDGADPQKVKPIPGTGTVIVVQRSAKLMNDFADFMETIRGAKRRANRKGRDCDLTRQIALDLWTRCNGRCEVTGIEFDFTRLAGQKLRPFAPSIDRIDNHKGYTAENSRVVCIAVNLAMNQWGEHVLRKIAASFQVKEVAA